MVLKRVTASAGPSGQAVVGGARASAARNPFRARSGTGVPRCRNSSSRWRASSVPNAPDRTRSVAAARAMRGARGCGALEAAAAAVTAVENRARDDMAPRDFGRLVPGFRCVSCPSSRGEARLAPAPYLAEHFARARHKVGWSRLAASGDYHHRGMPPQVHCGTWSWRLRVGDGAE
jgi:hypothetical protein